LATERIRPVDIRVANPGGISAKAARPGQTPQTRFGGCIAARHAARSNVLRQEGYDMQEQILYEVKEQGGSFLPGLNAGVSTAPLWPHYR